MVQSAEASRGTNRTADWRRNRFWAPYRRVFPEPQMRPVLVLVVDVLSHQPFQMALIEDDHVIQQVTSATPDPALRDTVLPRTTEGSPNWLAAHVFRSGNNFVAKLCVAVKYQRSASRLVRPSLPHLLTTQRGLGNRVTLKWRIFRRSWPMVKKQCSTPKVSVGTVKKSVAAMASRWFRRKVSHRWAGSGALGARRSHRETVGSDTR